MSINKGLFVFVSITKILFVNFVSLWHNRYIYACEKDKTVEKQKSIK